MDVGRDVAVEWYQCGSELMRKWGLILVDSKCEVDSDEYGKLHVIDEVSTPDSSRLCGMEERKTEYLKIAVKRA